MDVKIVFVVVCLCALAISSTEAGIPKCCIKTMKRLPQKVLSKVYAMKDQNGSGACDITALKLYLTDRSSPICVPPQMKKVLERLIKNRLKA
uniref:Chemokine interleukin-8-like domain-containing protein n=1 Tax=Mastacembelus armatus TaxID=205130 RepID=A0A7N8WV77_9TELE